MNKLSIIQKKILQYHSWKNMINGRPWLKSTTKIISDSRNLSTYHSYRKPCSYKNATFAWFQNREGSVCINSNCATLQHSRFISTTLQLNHGDDDLKNVPETVRVIFISKDGSKTEVMGKVGERAMYLAHRKGIDMEGACEASLACTTCHCYIDSSDEHWDLLPEATEKEEDLLDMAPFLDVNSRLGCQIILSQEIDGIVLRLPRATKNFYVDGHKPQPH